MKFNGKLFINRRTGQGSVTLPKKVLEQIIIDSNKKKFPKNISFEILNPKYISNGNRRK